MMGTAACGSLIYLVIAGLDSFIYDALFEALSWPYLIDLTERTHAVLTHPPPYYVVEGFFSSCRGIQIKTKLYRSNPRNLFRQYDLSIHFRGAP